MKGVYIKLTRLMARVILSSNAAAFAQVTLDGTLGPAGSLSGPHYQIPAELGRQVGGNLFHSFGQFSINTGQSATFSGPASVRNVIGRVTGGERSWLDGSLRSTLPSADLYLLNPAGILFGPNASLEVNGSFYASTANYLRLGEEGRFDATKPQNSLLTSAPPNAFGFLGDNPAPLSIQGSTLQVPEGKTLSLMGGDLTLDSSQLAAPGGQLQIASAGSAGEVTVSETSLATTRSTVQGKAITVSSSALDTSGEAAGRIHITGGRIELAASQVGAETLNREGGPIDIEANSLFLSDNTQVASSTRGEGNAGAVKVNADHLEIRGGSAISSITLAGGKAGPITVDAERLLISGDGSPGLTAIGNFAGQGSTGDAGSVTVKAKQLSIARNGATNLTGIGTTALEGSSGNAGETRISAGEIELRDGGNIGSGTFSQGNAGKVTIEADRLLIDGNDFFDSENRILTAIASTAQPGSAGNGGELQVTADAIEIRNGGAITSGTFSQGSAGRVKVKAKSLRIDGGGAQRASTGIDSNTDAGSTGNAGKVIVEADYLLIDGNDSLQITGITSDATPALGRFPSSTGNAGKVQVIAKDLTLRNGGTISSSTFVKGNAGGVTVTADRLVISGMGLARIPNTDLPMPSGISSSAEPGSTGTGGTVKVKAKQIFLDNQAVIKAQSLGEADAGDIKIQTENLRLQNAGISTQALQSGGGSIEIQSRDFVTLISSNITTSVAGGNENAGNITIAEPAALTLVEGSRIQANAIGGNGGNLKVTADTLLANIPLEAILTATSARGINGRVEIDSPDVDISAGLVPLPSIFFDATTLLTQPCAERSGAEVISLAVRTYQVLPESPYALRASLPKATSALSRIGQTAASRNSRTLNWLLPPVGECKAGS